MVKISCRSATLAVARPCEQPSGTGRTDAIAFGSIQRTATSRAGSDTSTLAATFTDDESCTSADRRVADGALVRHRRARSRRRGIPTRAWSASTARRRCPATCGRRKEGSASSGSGRRRARGADGLDLRVRRPSARGRRRGRRRYPPSASIGRPCPGTRPGGPIPPCSSRDADSTSTVPSSPVTIRRGAALAGLSLTSSAWRGTGVAFRSASSRTTLM